MSKYYRKEWWLFLTCDGCGADGEFRGLDQQQADRFARDARWSLGKRHLCPSCNPKQSKETNDDDASGDKEPCDRLRVGLVMPDMIKVPQWLADLEYVDPRMKAFYKALLEHIPAEEDIRDVLTMAEVNGDIQFGVEGYSPWGGVLLFSKQLGRLPQFLAAIVKKEPAMSRYLVE